MKTLRLIGTTLLMVVLCLNFTACGDDNEEDNRPLSEKLLGKWILVYEEGYEKNPAYPEHDEEWSRVPEGECYDYGHLTFRADGTFTEYELDNSVIGNGKWTLADKIVSLRYGSDTDTYELKVTEITATKLVLVRDEVKPDGDKEYSKMTYQKK